MGSVLSWWKDNPSAPPADQAQGTSPEVTPNLTPDDAVIDQDSPLVDHDLYLRLAKEGAFPSRWVGKKRTALWGSVKAAFTNGTDNRRIKRKAPMAKKAGPPPAPQNDGLDHLRAQIGLVKKKGT